MLQPFFQSAQHFYGKENDPDPYFWLTDPDADPEHCSKVFDSSVLDAG